MNILITGINGHIGSQIAISLLSAGHTIFGLDIKDDHVQELFKYEAFHFLLFDITGTESLPADFSNVDIFIHCASLVHKSSKDLSREHFFKVNHEGTKNMLRVLSGGHLKRIIFLSSVSVYGNFSHDSVPDEDTPCQPLDSYGESKVAAEREIRAFSNDRSIPFTIFRLPPAYGTNFLLNVHKRVYLPHRIAFYKIGSGRQRISLCSIPNIVQAIQWCLDNSQSRNEIYILKDLSDYSMNDLIRMLKEIYSQKMRLVIPIAAWIPKFFFKGLTLFFPAKGRRLSVQFRKVEKDHCFSEKKIRSAGFFWDSGFKKTMTCE